MPETIKFQIENNVARLALNSPPLNIINIAMMAEMGEVVQSLKNQPSVRVLVIEAVEGSKAFSAGVDRYPVTKYLRAIHSLIRRVRYISRLSVHFISFHILPTSRPIYRTTFHSQSRDLELAFTI